MGLLRWRLEELCSVPDPTWETKSSVLCSRGDFTSLGVAEPRHRSVLPGLQQFERAAKDGANRLYEGVSTPMSLGQELAPHLPFLRRYARALTGSQTHGDAFVRATLEAIVAKPDEFPRDVDPRLGLYKTFHAIWSTANIEEGEEPPRGPAGPEGIAHARLSRITPLSRQALLLTSLEGFSSEDTAYLINASPADVDSLVAEALEEIERQTLADVLIIEDAPIIAMDIETS